jgi:8-oxo-dGTP pyrophosphatase MutT (NUDIX family)
MAPKLWEIVSTRKDRTSSFFNLRVDHARSPRTGETYDFYVLESSPWVNVLPITPDNKIVLVRQYRHGIRDNTLELPGGVIEPKDSPLQAALRELQEETGYTTSEIVELGWLHPNPAIQSNRCYTYLAKDVVLSGAQDQDDREDIEVVLCPLSEIPEMIRTGIINHALIIAAFHLYFLTYPEAHCL